MDTLLDGSDRLPEESEGLPKRSEGRSEGLLDGSAGLPEESKGLPEWSEGLRTCQESFSTQQRAGGQRIDVWMYEQTEFLPILKDHAPYSGHCQ